MKDYLRGVPPVSLFLFPSSRVCDYIVWSMVPASGKEFQEGLLFRQIRPRSRFRENWSHILKDA
jgi:hypothetical protein